MPERVVSDADVTLWHGDVLEVLASLPDESVDCVVTSPPYWGLRDYGTGGWEGGDETCDHQPPGAPRSSRPAGGLTGGKATVEAATIQRDTCHCGARRVDQQLGLEPTPDQYVLRIVEVFREVRRVLAAHGTCWVNLGDSYVSTAGSIRTISDGGKAYNDLNAEGADGRLLNSERQRFGKAERGDLKPKDLVGIPWRVAFALQADGWWLRSDIIWAKPNPMPESVTDRPTKAHEYVFLLTKQPRYWFDQEAVREPAEWARWGDQTVRKDQQGASSWIQPKPKEAFTGGRDSRQYDGEQFKTTDERNTRFQGPSPVDGGRNVRSVWTVATQPYPEAHFATYPEELVRRCVLAGCPVRVCTVCGKPSERIVDVSYEHVNNTAPRQHSSYVASQGRVANKIATTTGWSDCGHNTWRPGLVLDPFAGSGTTCKVARDHGRHSIGIDLSADYLELAARRLQQLSLLSEL